MAPAKRGTFLATLCLTKYEETAKILCMRILFLAFVIIITSICNGFATSYQTEIVSCDKLYEIQSKKSNSTISIIQSLSEHTDCYQKIIFKIIDVKYKQNADKMKQNFIVYIDAAGEMIDFIDRPDSCYPQCGTIIGINAATARRDAAKQYLNLILNSSAAI